MDLNGMINKAKEQLTDERIDSIAEMVKGKTPDKADSVVDTVAGKAKDLND